jgi:uncharacterized protein (DUF2147 family)
VKTGLSPFCALAITALSACASTYVPPVGTSASVSVEAAATKADLMRAARRVLALEGYQIASADDASGVISTLPRTTKVGPEIADCGSNVGIENAYLKDARTLTRLALNVIAQDRRLTVRATVDADYRPGSQVQDMTLTCISKGELERGLAAKILSAV